MHLFCKNKKIQWKNRRFVPLKSTYAFEGIIFFIYICKSEVNEQVENKLC